MNYAGVELGGTKCVLMLAGGPNDVLAREAVATTSPTETLSLIEATLRQWKSGPGFEALGLASFGPLGLDPALDDYGHTLATPKPGWAQTDILGPLQTAAGVP